LSVRQGLIVFAFAAVAAIVVSPIASAQKGAGAKPKGQKAQAAQAAETGKAAQGGAGAAPETAKDDTAAEEEADAGIGDEDEGTVPPLELKSFKEPSSVDLDMSALGEMDPQKDLQKSAAEDAAAAAPPQDWTDRAMELLELHGYFRVRPELYHKFYVRNDDAVFQRPAEQQYNSTTDPEGYLGEDCREDNGGRRNCNQPTLAGANMRLRLEPTLNISEEVWVKTQIDFLDNVMLGSSPSSYQSFGSGDTIDRYTVEGYNMGPPSSEDMIVVRRAWGEVLTPIGQIRFGRMPDQWGLGMLHNAGNGIDQDFGDSVDRLMFAVKINDWLLAPAFDFPNEGKSFTSASGLPFDAAQLDDAYQLTGIAAFKHDEEEQRALLKRGDVVINTGLHFQYRTQVLSFDYSETDDDATDATDGYHFFRRDMWNITPDFWFQLLYDTFHLEIEAALIYGEVGNPDKDVSNFDDAQALTLIQWGGVAQVDYGLLSDQLRLGIEVGFASGDQDVEGVYSPTTFDQVNGRGSSKYTAFSFNPAFTNDLIMYHSILGAVSQSYYFRPWISYDFLRSAMGKKLGIRFDIVYSRAMFAETTISDSSANLGVELDGQVMYVSADNFHAALKYGVLFPLGAFKGAYDPDGETGTLYESFDDQDLTIPQTLQVILGISF
jgi:uncharacterized protein (TIGR04551 family)